MRVMEQQIIKDLADEPKCGNCGSGSGTALFHAGPNKLQDALRRRREGKELTPEELKRS